MTTLTYPRTRKPCLSARSETVKSLSRDSAIVQLVLALLNASVAAANMAISSVGGGAPECILLESNNEMRLSSPRALGTRTG